MGKYQRAIAAFAIIVAVSLIGQFALANSTEKAENNTLTALPTKSAVFVNGKVAAFSGYYIDGNNYFKLRDIAMALNGTEKQFDISYDEKNDAIFTLLGRPYTIVGGELEKSDDVLEKQARITMSSVYFNGTKTQVTVYNIGGYNFFKLRDVAAAVSFRVRYEEESGNILIDTTKEYISPLAGIWVLTPDNKFMSLTYLQFTEDDIIRKFGGSRAMTYTADNDSVTFHYPGGIDYINQLSYINSGVFSTNTKQRLYIPGPNGSKIPITDSGLPDPKTHKKIEKFSYKISTLEGNIYLEIPDMLSEKYVLCGSIEGSGAEALIGFWVGSSEEYTMGAGSPYEVKSTVQNYIYFNSDGEFSEGKAYIGLYSYTKDSITSDLPTTGYSNMKYRIYETNESIKLELILANGTHQVFSKAK